MKSTIIREDVSGQRIKCQIKALTHSASQKNKYAIVLSEINNNRGLAIVMGGFEAQAIAVAMERMTPNRPLTHDLAKNIIEGLNFTLKEICIDSIKSGIFCAKIQLTNQDSLIEFDCRVSDAIALAVRFDVPIYIYDFILDKHGVNLEDKI